MDTKYLQEVAEYRVAYWWNKFVKLYPSIARKGIPPVKLNNRLKTTAGRAFYEDHYIDLSTELFWEYTEEFLHDTIPHELAHLVAYTVYGDTGHGRGWYTVINTMGIATTRLHNMVNSQHAKRRSK